MNFFSSMYYSYKMAKLQKIIHPPENPIDLDGLKNRIGKGNSGSGPKEKALQDYLDICESKPTIQDAMKKNSLSRESLIEIYWSLLATGCGQWVHEHFAALSSLIYVEPLLYCVEAKKFGKTPQEIGMVVMEYWHLKGPNGFLMAKLAEDKRQKLG